MELDIIKILGNDKTKYYKYRKYIHDTLVSKYGVTILADFNHYFKEFDTEKKVDFTNFPTWFYTTRHPRISVEDKEVYDKIFSAIPGHKVDPMLENGVIKSFIARDYAANIADEALKIAEGEAGADMGKVRTLYKDYERDTGKAAEVDAKFVTDDITTILSKTVGPSGLDWRLDCLNESLGPLRTGDFVLFGKRPDSGGTTLLCSEATYMAQQLPEDKYVLWINNEEKGESVKMRQIQAALGITVAQLKLSPKTYFADYQKILAGKLKVFDDAKASIYDVEELLSRGDVGLLVIDQMWKLKGFEQFKSEVKQQEQLFNTGREWAKAYCPVLVVHQADGSAEGQMWISQNQLYGSKTAVQGELDAIVTIGRTLDPGQENRRFIWIPKNKLCGGPLSDPLKRNGRFEVVIQPEIARFKDI